MTHRPTYVENFHLKKTDMSPKTRQHTFEHELAINGCFRIEQTSNKNCKRVINK